MGSRGGELHIAVLPWLAAGHITPLLELSARLALLGHRISFLSTPSTLDRLDPSDLPPLLRLVPLTPPTPPPVHSTADLTDATEHLRYDLRSVYDSLAGPLADFLSSASTSQLPVDWILCDFAPYCAPAIARSHNVRSAHVSVLHPAARAFFGPSVAFGHDRWLRPDAFTTVPEWIPFPTSVAFRPHETRALQPAIPVAARESGRPAETGGSGRLIIECDVVAVRGSFELEPEWLELLPKLYEKTVLPLGHLPPAGKSCSNEWAGPVGWLDKQARGSVVYVGFGSEARLSKEQIYEIARGLELSGLPFFWALRWPGGLEEVLPVGFGLRTEGRGMICQGWVPQVSLLGHPAVGGFMMHAGWGSAVEGLQFGLALILIPLIFDQPLNARVLVEKGVAKEVPRDAEDGRFDGDAIARTLRSVMLEEGDSGCRSKSRAFMTVLGDKELQDTYVEKFVDYLVEHRPAR